MSALQGGGAGDGPGLGRGGVTGAWIPDRADQVVALPKNDQAGYERRMTIEAQI